jgi:hypothetical protein
MSVYLVEAGGVSSEELKRLCVAAGIKCLWVCPTVEAVQMAQGAVHSGEVPHFNLCCPLAPHASESKPTTQAQSTQWLEEHGVGRELLPYPPTNESIDDAQCRIDEWLPGVMTSIVRSASAGHCVVLDGSTLMAFDKWNVGHPKLRVSPGRVRGVVAKYALHASNKGVVMLSQIQ